MVKAMQELTAERGSATWREAGERALVGYAKAREVVQNMTRAGELEVVGSRRVARSRRPCLLFRWVPPQQRRQADHVAVALHAIASAWSSRSGASPV